MTRLRRCSPCAAIAAAVLSAGLARPARAITYGFSDTAGAYGNVGVFAFKTPDGQLYAFCSGTLVAPNVFLTASHCTDYFDRYLTAHGYVPYVSFDGSIPFGSLTDPGTQLHAVAAVVTNPAYNQAQSDSGDVGALVLASPVTDVTPASLPACGLLDDLAARNGLKDAVFTAVGYGLQDRVVGGGVPYNEDANPVPRMFAFSAFNALSPGYVRLSQNPALGNGGTCYGDSGGPDFLVVGGRLVLAAVTATGDSACRSTNVDYRMDVPTAIGFLALVNETYGTSIPVAPCP